MGIYDFFPPAKVFSEHPDCAPDLDLVLRLPLAEEKARQGLKDFKHSARSSPVVLMVKHKDQPVQPQTSEGLSKNGSAKCGCCGSAGHKHGAPACPARNQNCGHCGKVGHLEECFRKKKPRLEERNSSHKEKG
ncbi:MAG: hypothetical protein GY696_10320 [Gammaproteobacteria bacterium]|nr:hypothetical protein [Gammaproteobacteria bacterium]